MPAKGSFQPYCIRGHERTLKNIIPSSGGCRECRKTRRNTTPKTPEFRKKHAQDNREWSKKNPRSVLNTQLKNKYGITVAQYEEQLEKQQGLCAICKKVLSNRAQFGPDRPVVDHCHEKLKIRGILCSNCNCGIGLLQENPEILLQAAAYIKQGATNDTTRE